jgi:uncharacterized protein with NRDE domain
MLQKPPYRPVGRVNYRRCAFAPTNRAYNKVRDSIRALLTYNVCLILFANEANPRYRLVLAANRDELYSRPTAPAAYWEEAPNVLAGKDLESGGTWLGVTRSGRVAAVTNFRGPGKAWENAPSRGNLVRGFLMSSEPPDVFVDKLRTRAWNYNGFNLLVGSDQELWWYSNRYDEQPHRIVPGIHGLSNHLLDTPWPKVERGKRALERLIVGEKEITAEQVFPILEDRSPAADEELPDTGVGQELERVLSAPFISTQYYGTRSSTVLLIEHTGSVTFVERSFNPRDESQKEARYEFRIEP